MIKYVIVLSWCDRSGIVGVYGTYQTEDMAKSEIEKISRLPGMNGGLWEVFPMTELLIP